MSHFDASIIDFGCDGSMIGIDVACGGVFSSG
jgi:hypothetical protein